MKAFSVLVLAAALAPGLLAQSTSGIREYSFRFSDLAYDSTTQRLYGVGPESTNQLVRVDPESGEAQLIPTGPRPSRLAVDSDHGLWVGLDGSGEIVRLNLQTMAVENTIAMPGSGGFTDISPSAADPLALLVCRGGIGYYVRRGTVLPDAVILTRGVMDGSYVFGDIAGSSAGDGVYRNNLTPNGITAGVVIPFLVGGPNFVAHQRRIYHGSGAEFDGSTGESLPGFYLPWWAGVSTAVNEEEDSVYQLSTYFGRWTLNRFDRLSRLHTGLAEFVPDAQPGNLVAWSSNRVAFHSSHRLFVAETDKLFLPSDLGLIQTVSPANPSFGDTVTVSLVITNRGPGPALDFKWNAAFDTNAFVVSPANFSTVLSNSYYALLAVNPQVPTGPPNVGNPGFIFDAGRHLTVGTVTLLPLRAGTLTNRIGVTSGNEVAPEDNAAQFVTPIAAPSADAPVVRLKIPAAEIAADPISGRLFFMARQHLFTVEPRRFELSQPINSGDVRHITFCETEPYALFGYGNNPGVITRLDTRSLAVSGTWNARGGIYDLALSPASGGSFYALSDTAGLLEGHVNLGEPSTLIATPGPIEYSADGARLYHLDLNTCALEIYSITRVGESQGTLALEHSQPSVSCADFRRANGLLYFDDGVVYDPAARQKAGQIAGISTPGYVAPDRFGNLNVLTRTNDLWVVRRYASTNLNEPFATIEIGTLPAAEPPLEAVAFGESQMAFRTSSTLYLLSIGAASSQPELSIARSAGGEIRVRFNSTAGARYRLESTPQLPADAWTISQSGLAGTGAPIELGFSPAATATYFRLIRE